VKIYGLTQDRWDSFKINLSEEKFTFDRFKKILEQTANSDLYYFKPEFLQVNLVTDKMKNTDPVKQSVVTAAAQRSGSDNLMLPDPSDVIITLNGSFFVRN